LFVAEMADAEAQPAREKQARKAKLGVLGMQIKALLVQWQLRQVR
jgi:hypothetical protein